MKIFTVGGNMGVRNPSVAEIKGWFSQNENTGIYSPSCCSKPVWRNPPFFFF